MTKKRFMKYLLSFVAVFAMAVALVGLNVGKVSAAGTGTITINVPSGTPTNARNEYKIYKIFDGNASGENMSYKLPSGRTTTENEWTNANMSTYFSVDNVGNVTATESAKSNTNNADLSSEAVNAIKNYVNSLLNASPAKISPVATVNPTYDSTNKKWGNNTATGLVNGYYYVTTTTGSAVSITSTKPDATVNDKTEVPSVDKTITAVKDNRESDSVNAGSVQTNGKKALAEVGSVVSFKAEVTIGKNATNYIFEDTLPKNSSGDYTLQLVGGSGKVYKNSISTENLISQSDNTYTFTEAPGNEDHWTFQVSFKNALTSTMSKDENLIITYDTIVTSAALLQDSPAINSAIVAWGEPHHTNISQPSTTETYNARISVTKNFEDITGESVLPDNDNAEFVLASGSGADIKYYKIAGDSTATGKDNVTWVNSIDQATKISFNKTGETKTFTGLANGTYTLIESKTPAGYTTAPNQTITINDADAENAYTAGNLSKTAIFENNKGSLLPSTGGMGTKIFYTVGVLIVAAAVVLLIKRKKATKAE